MLVSLWDYYKLCRSIKTPGLSQIRYKNRMEFSDEQWLPFDLGYGLPQREVAKRSLAVRVEESLARRRDKANMDYMTFLGI